MIQYSPREINGNVNVSSKSPLLELFKLLAGILATLVILYIILGLIVDALVIWTPEKVDSSLTVVFNNKFPTGTQQSQAEQDIQRLLEELTEHLNEHKPYTVQIVPNPEANALALPGRRIIIFSKLLEDIDSENELAFVLGHELGHFANRDHLRGLGRTVVLFMLSTVITGHDSEVNKFFQQILVNTEMKFSQRQEKQADLFALTILHKQYGHASGAESFMKKMKAKEKLPKFLYFFATHPHVDKRIKVIQNTIRKEGYPLKKKLPLSESIKKLQTVSEKTD